MLIYRALIYYLTNENVLPFFWLKHENNFNIYENNFNIYENNLVCFIFDLQMSCTLQNLKKVMQNSGQIIISDKAGIITFLRNQTIHKFILCKGSWNYLCKILWKMKQEYIDDLSQFIYICIYIRKLKKNYSLYLSKNKYQNLSMNNM